MTKNATSPALSRLEFVGLIAAIMALNALAIDVMLPALPYMGHGLGVATENGRQFVITAYMLGLGVAQLLTGPLTDRFGRRKPLLVGLGIYVTCALLAALAPNFALLLVLRFLQGCGAAGTRVVAISVVRDRFTGRAMAEIMSLVFMVFMIVPIIAPGIGQVLLLIGPWQTIFIFMGVIALAFGIWAYARLPETLPVQARRPLTLTSVTEAFVIVFSNRLALFYGFAGMFMFGALMGFVNVSQQIYVGIYGLGVYFPVAFAAVALLMALSSFLNSRMVGRFGMRRISHLAILIFIAISALLLALSLLGTVPFWLFFLCFSLAMFMFGWSSSNMNSLSMEPLGEVAGTASSVFGFIQTAGGAVLAILISQQFDGTITPLALSYLGMGGLALGSVLIAERGKLFGVGKDYAHPGPTDIV